MDDSPLKAYLQPYNHLCIREYTSALRQIDVQCRQREQRAQQISNSHATSLASQPQPQADTIPPPTSSSEPAISTLNPTDDASPSESPALSQLSPTLPPSKHADKKRKRPKKKHTEHELAAEDDLDLELGGYDPTLLAIIGVLEKIKWEGNVAGWVRSGGLAKSCFEEEEKHENETGVKEKDQDKQKQENENENENEGVEEEGEKEDENSASTPTDASAPQDPKRRRVSDEHSALPLTNGEPASAPPSPSLATLAAAAASSSLPTAATMLETIGDTGQWFEDKTVMRYWVRKGVKALEELKIEVTSGIVA